MADPLFRDRQQPFAYRRLYPAIAATYSSIPHRLLAMDFLWHETAMPLKETPFCRWQNWFRTGNVL